MLRESFVRSRGRSPVADRGINMSVEGDYIDGLDNLELLDDQGEYA